MVPIQQFSADELFDFESLDTAEIYMGADGIATGGWLPQLKPQRIMLQADSASGFLFDAWKQAQDAQREVFTAFGTIILPSIGTQYTLNLGFLKAYVPVPRAAKVLQPRTFGITWGYVNSSPYFGL